MQRNAQAFVNDAAGNLTDDGTRTCAYDAEQRLVRLGNTGTGRSSEFRYDAFGPAGARRHRNLPLLIRTR